MSKLGGNSAEGKSAEGKASLSRAFQWQARRGLKHARFGHTPKAKGLKARGKNIRQGMKGHGGMKGMSMLGREGHKSCKARQSSQTAWQSLRKKTRGGRLCKGRTCTTAMEKVLMGIDPVTSRIQGDCSTV